MFKSLKFKNSYLIIIIRIAIIGSLVVAWISPSQSPAAREITIIFVLDVSDSITVVHQKCHKNTIAIYRQQLSDYLATLTSNCRWGAVFFAAEAEIATPMHRYDGEVYLTKPKVSGHASNLYQGIELALELSANAPRRRLVLISDGQFSDDDQRRVRDRLAASKVPLLFFSALTQLPLKDVSLDNLVIAPMAHRHEQLSGYATIYTSSPGRFRVVVASGKQLLRDVRLAMTNRGRARIYFSLAVSAASRQVVQAWVESLSFKDQFRQNNHYRTQIRVIGPARVLIAGAFLPASGLSGNITQVRPEQLASFTNLNQFQVIIISQGDAATLAPVATALQRYVFSGGGLLVLGSKDTLGPGGYADTALEKALPIWCLPENQRPLALLVALDVSGSMGEVVDGNSKMQLAKEALARCLSMLAGDDLFSLLVFPRAITSSYSIYDGGASSPTTTGYLTKIASTRWYRSWHCFTKMRQQFYHCWR